MMFRIFILTVLISFTSCDVLKEVQNSVLSEPTNAEIIAGLKEARAEIAKNTEMDAQMRAEVLKALDEKIAAWKSRN